MFDSTSISESNGVKTVIHNSTGIDPVGGIVVLGGLSLLGLTNKVNTDRKLKEADDRQQMLETKMKNFYARQQMLESEIKKIRSPMEVAEVRQERSDAGCTLS